MRSFLLLVLVGVSIAVLLPSPAIGQTPRPTFLMQIQIQVRLADGSAAPQGCMCELEQQNGEPIDQAQTDSSGKCRFNPSNHAIFKIRIKSAGYLDGTQIVDLQNTQTGTAFIVLKPIPGQEPPAAA